MAISNEQLLAFVKKNPIGVGCGILSLGIVGFMYYRGGALETMAADRDAAGQQRDKHSLNIKNSAQLQEQLDQMVAANKAVEQRLIRSSDRFINVNYFVELAEASGARVITNRQDSEPKAASKGGFVQVPFSVSVQGTFEQVMDFLRRLEYGKHYARITYNNASKLQGENVAGDQITLTLNLELLGRP